MKVECQYWDKATDNWSTEGCVASPPPSGRPDGFLHCNCTHLTDFGGISFPTSPEELLAELTSIKFTFFTMDDFANILGGGLDFAGNPEISITLFTVAALDILMIAYSKFRAHRRVLRRGREAAARRKELRDQARQKAREKASADPDLLEERRRRKAAGMGKNAQAAAAKEEKEKSKRNPPIQDRVFLDLLDADMTGAEPEPSPPPRSRPETPDSLKPKLVGPDPLMAELLAPGDALPAMPAMSPGDGPAVPWAELLQQRIRSGGRGSTPTGTPPSGGVGCRMIQQRLPSKATLGSREPTPPVRSSGGPRPGRSPFNSQRIPYVNGPPAALGQAIREGTPGAAGTGSTPVRLDSLRRSPGLSPGSPTSPSGGDNAGTMRQGRIPNLRGQAPGSLSSKLKESRSGGLPTTPEQGEPSVPMPVGEDGTVSTRLPMRGSRGMKRVGSTGGLILSDSKKQLMAGGQSPMLDDPPSVPPSPPSALEEHFAKAPTKSNRFLQRLSAAAAPAVAEQPAGPSRPEVGLEELDETTPMDAQMSSLLDAVSGALHEATPSAAPVGNTLAELSRRQPAPPKLQSSRMMLRPERTSAPHTIAEGDNEEPPEPPKPKMMSSRLKMLPKPPSEAEKTDDPIAKMRAELEEATKAAAPSGTTCFGTTVEMKSSRLRMLHKPSTANAAAGEGGAPSGDEPQPSLNVESLKEQIAKMRAAGAMPGVPTWETPRDPTAGPPAKKPMAGLLAARLKAGASTPAADEPKGKPALGSLLKRASTQSLEKKEDSGHGGKIFAMVKKVHVPENLAGSAAKMSKLGMLKMVGALGGEGKGEAAKEAAKAAKQELKEAFSSPGGFYRANKRLLYRSTKRIRKFMYDFWTIARSEHTIINAAAPPEEDILGDTLQDEQVIHIFWLMMLVELFFINMMSQTQSPSDFAPVQILIMGVYVSFFSGFMGMIFKIVFKFCNKKRRRQSFFDRMKRKWHKYKKSKKKAAKLKAKQRAAKARGEEIDEPSMKEEGGRRSLTKQMGSMGALLTKEGRQKAAARARWEERQSWRGSLEETFMPAKVQRMRRQAERKAQASIKIQGLIRRRAARKELLKRRKDQGYDAAALQMQKVQRAKKARQEVLQKRAERKQQNDAAATLQKVARGRQIRKERRQQNEAATKVQAIMRGRQARKNVGDIPKPKPRSRVMSLMPSRARTPKKAPTEEDLAATKLQSIQRGRSSRKGKKQQPPSPPASPPDDAAPTPSPFKPKNRFLQRLAASTPELDDGAGIGGGAAASSSTPQVAARPHAPRAGVESIPVKAVLGTPVVGKPIGAPELAASSSKPKVSFAKLLKEQGAAKIDPVAAGGAPAVAPVKANKFLAKLSAANMADAAGGAAGAPAAEKPNKLLLKAFGGGAAAGGGSGAAGGDVFKTNRFLAGFAAKVDGGGEADGGGEGDDAGGKTRGKALWSKAKGVVTTTRMKVSAEEAERIRRSKLVPFSRRYILLRWTIGWIIMIAIFIILMLFNFMYGVKFGGADATAILISWGAACIQTFLIVEPSEVLGLVLLPSVAENKYVAWCRTNLKEYGFI